MMKILTRLMSLFAVAALTVTFMNCGGGGGETPAEQVQLGKLSKTWNLVSVTKDGQPAPTTQISPSFKLTIGGTFNSSSPEGPYTYSHTGSSSPSPWPASGTWIFNQVGTGDSGSIARDDGIGMFYSIAGNGNLTITFTFVGDGYPGAKSASVNNNWVFVLN